MKIPRILWLLACKAYYAHACARKPLHPDLPFVLHKRVEVNDQLRSLIA